MLEGNAHKKKSNCKKNARNVLKDVQISLDCYPTNQQYSQMLTGLK